jgi:ATP-binding cassette, subfamily B, bacterial
MQNYSRYRHSTIRRDRRRATMQNKEPKTTTKEMPPVRLVLNTLKYFYREAFHYQPWYFAYVITSILINALAPFINILLPKIIIDELMGDRDIKKMVTVVLIILVGNMIANIAKNFISDTMGKYTDRFERYFKVKISEKTMSMDFEHTEDPQALEQASRAETGMDWYSGGIAGLTGSFMNIISNSITLAGVVVVMAMGSPILLMVIVIGVATRTLITAKVNAVNVKHFKGLVALNRTFGYIFWQLSDFRFGKDIRLYGATKMMLEKATTHTDAQVEKWRKQSMEQLPLNEMDVAISAVTDGITYFYLGYLAIKKLITIGDFTMLIAAAGSFGGSLRAIIWNLQEIHKKSTFMQEYIKFMEYKATMQTGTKSVPKAEDYEFCFVNVSFKYPRSEDYVLRNVNLTLSSKEHLSVVGLNGAGKTTFIKLLCRLYDVTEGAILLNGVNIKEYVYDEYMKLFAVVFQDYRLFAFSMKENILLEDDIPEGITIKKNPYNDPLVQSKIRRQPEVSITGLKEEATVMDKDRKAIGSDTDLQELCKICGLEEKINSLEKGLDTVLYKQFEEDGIEPSGGESQKLAIARALHKDAPVVILDEPTAALDPMAEYEIYNQFDRLVGGKTAVYISHRLSSCKFCDRIAVFSKETVAEYGTHEELVKIPGGIYAEMFAAQAQYYVE